MVGYIHHLPNRIVRIAVTTIVIAHATPLAAGTEECRATEVLHEDAARRAIVLRIDLTNRDGARCGVYVCMCWFMVLPSIEALR